MTKVSRRRFLGDASLLGASAVLADGFLGAAHADKPVSFSGWVFKPDTVKRLREVLQPEARAAR